MKKRQLHILIVDDEANILDALKTHLELENYLITTADKADTALALVKKHRYDIVLTDINMPKMDGIEFLEEIKRVNQETLVIMMTAYTTVSKVILSRVEGAFDYILKPFRDLDEIDCVINRAVELIQRWDLIIEETRQTKHCAAP